MTLDEAIAAGHAAHKAPATAASAELVYACIARLADELDDEDDELRALAAAVLEDRSSMGRRARDLAAEMARRVASARRLMNTGD